MYLIWPGIGDIVNISTIKICYYKNCIGILLCPTQPPSQPTKKKNHSQNFCFLVSVFNIILSHFFSCFPYLAWSNPKFQVGLALVVEGEIVLGVMGCPNWQEDLSSTEVQEDENKPSGPGIIMVSHVGCGTWIKRFYNILDISPNMPDCWNRSFVDQCCLVHEARFCIPESQTWESLPLSDVKASADGISIADKEILLLPTCCGRSVVFS